MCENHLGFYFFKNIGGLQELPRVSDFSKEKNSPFWLGGSQQIKNSQFFGLVLTSWISKLSNFFWKFIFLH
jgi:hypothetical protein